MGPIHSVQLADLEMGPHQHSCTFVLLKPTKLKGWAFEDGVSTAEGVPTIPFEIDLQVETTP